jgi:hypothetical protein
MRGQHARHRIADRVDPIVVRRRDPERRPPIPEIRERADPELGADAEHEPLVLREHTERAELGMRGALEHVEAFPRRASEVRGGDHRQIDAMCRDVLDRV